MRRPMPLPAALALIAALGAPAHAQVTVNGSPATIGGVFQFVFDGQNISSSHPLPVAVVSNTGSQAVTQGTTPWQVSGNATANGSGNPLFVNVTNLPGTQAVTAGQLPASLGAKPAAASLSIAPATDATFPVTGTVGVSNAFALDATLTARLGTLGQKTMAGSAPVTIATDQSSIPVTPSNASTAATSANQASEIAALGAPGDAVNANTLIGQAKQANALLAASTPAGTNTIGSLANISGTISLPTGAATSAKQDTQITAEQTIAADAPRSVIYSEVSANTAVAANANLSGAVRSNASSCASWVAYARADQAATLNIDGSDNTFTSRGFNVGTADMTANTTTMVKVPAIFASLKAYVTMKATAGNVTVLSLACVAN